MNFSCYHHKGYDVAANMEFKMESLVSFIFWITLAILWLGALVLSSYSIKEKDDDDNAEMEDFDGSYPFKENILIHDIDFEEVD